MSYHASPVVCCQCPARWFATEALALAYARENADANRIAYRVWSVIAGRVKSVATFAPSRNPECAGNLWQNWLDARDQRC